MAVPYMDTMPVLNAAPSGGLEFFGGAPVYAQAGNGYQQGQVPGGWNGNNPFDLNANMGWGNSGGGGFWSGVGKALPSIFSVVGSLFGAKGASDNAKQARADAIMRMGQIDRWTQPFLNTGPSQANLDFSSFLNQLKGQGPMSTTYSPFSVDPVQAAQVNTGQFDPSRLNLPSWIQTEIQNASPINAEFARAEMTDPNMVNRFMDFNQLSDPSKVGASNAGQDALLQMLQGKGGYNSITAQLDPTNGMALNKAVQGNTQFDNSAQFAALQPIEDRTRNESLAALNAQAGSLGRRFGTQTQDRSANLLQKLTEDANLRRQQIASSSFEAAQNRAIQASDLLNARDNMVNQVAMADQRASVDAAGNKIQGGSAAASSGASMYGSLLSALAARNSNIANLLGQGMDNSSRLALGNMQTGADISQFNAGAANDASLANATNFLTAQGQRSQQGIAQNDFSMRSAGLQSDALTRLAGLLQSNAAQANNVNMNNSNNALDASKANAANQLQTFLANLSANNSYTGNIMSGLTTLMNDSNSAQSRALQALGLRAGVALPTASAGVGTAGIGQGLGDLGTLLMMMQYSNNNRRG